MNAVTPYNWFDRIHGTCTVYFLFESSAVNRINSITYLHNLRASNGAHFQYIERERERGKKGARMVSQ